MTFEGHRESAQVGSGLSSDTSASAPSAMPLKGHDRSQELLRLKEALAFPESGLTEASETTF